MAVRFRVLFLFALVALPLRAQEPKPAQLKPADFGPAVAMSRAWRFHPGDDVRGADPGLDDSSWPAIDPTSTPDPLVRSAWFRRHLQVTPELQGIPFAMSVLTPGRAEVWADGKLVARVNEPGSEIRGNSRDSFFVTLSKQRDHLLAVHYIYPPGRFHFGGSGFLLYVGPAMRVIAQKPTEVERLTFLFTLFVTIPLLLALLHLSFYGFYRRRRENLFYGLTMIAFAFIVWADFRPALSSSFMEMEFLARATAPMAIATIFFTLLTYYSIRCRTFPRMWIAFLVLAVVLASGSFLSPLFRSWAWPLYFGLMILEVARMARGGGLLHREGTNVLVVALYVNGVFIALQLLIGFGIIPPPWGISSVYIVGMLAFAFGMSLFLALDFARTSTNLEARLVEVETLSTRVIEQEREAHEQELRAKLIEAESVRRARELEQARSLQLSMLPRSIPQARRLEVAVAMATASEVGGDYYDFRVADDGSLVVAVGDATGHGVAAGTMVSAMKALFTASAVENDLCEFLRQSDRVLRAMSVPLQMCFAVARITPRSVTFAAAAMPPLLVRRAQSGAVEEVGSGGLPLGGRLTATYAEETVPLESGDILLFATDGLPEMLDPSGMPLGFDGAEAALRDAACESAQGVVDALLARAAKWRASREQNDDMTLVVVRVV